MNTFNGALIAVMKDANRPVQLRELQKALLCPPENINTFNVFINLACRKGIIKRVKYPGIWSYYCRPEWVGEDGKIKSELNFDPYWGIQQTRK